MTASLWPRTMAGRPGWWSPAFTSGKARNGFAGSTSASSITRAIGKSSVTTITAIPGRSSGTGDDIARARNHRPDPCLPPVRGGFRLTVTRHEPRPVVWFRTGARILIVGQAPGLRVHESGVPFDDRSGDRLRDWLGMTRNEFYDRDRVAVVPMAFCFPGYDAKGSDLPPQPRCAPTWRAATLPPSTRVALMIVIGGYAEGGGIWVSSRARPATTATVADWRRSAPAIFQHHRYTAQQRLPAPEPLVRGRAIAELRLRVRAP